MYSHFYLSFCLSVVPLPNVTIFPGSVNVSYNAAVILTCVVQSLTTPTVYWMTNTNVTLPSTPLVSNNDNSIHYSTLILEQVTLEYIGEYTCAAQIEGEEISDMINIDVFEDIYYSYDYYDYYDYYSKDNILPIHIVIFKYYHTHAYIFTHVLYTHIHVCTIYIYTYMN